MLSDVILSLALSAHLGLSEEYNEVHPAIRIQKDHYIAGLYLNSENSISPYAGIELTYSDFFLDLGLVGGYEETTVLPFLRAGYNFNEHVGVFVSPAYEQSGILGAVVGLEFKF